MCSSCGTLSKTQFHSNRKMKILQWSLLLTLLCAIPCLAKPKEAKRPDPPKNPSPEIAYNYVKDETNVMAPSVNLQGLPLPLSIRASYSYEGKTPQRPETVRLWFLEYHTEPMWRDGGKFFVRYGDKKASYDMIPLNSKPVVGRWSETAEVAIPTDDFIEMCQADALYFQTVVTGDVLEKEWFAPLKNLAKSIPAEEKEREEPEMEEPEEQVVE